MRGKEKYVIGEGREWECTSREKDERRGKEEAKKTIPLEKRNEKGTEGERKKQPERE